MAIDIGADAIDRAGVQNPATIIALDNPANESGTIISIELYAYNVLSDCKVGTFSRDGDNFTCRDYATIGDVAAGSKQTFSVSLTCVTGDYIGVYYSGGGLERDSTGYAGIYSKSGDQFEAGEQTYALTANAAISVYGTSSYAICSYYFNSKSTSVWSEPEKMIDNILTNYAYTTSDSTEVLDGNSGPGTNLGTITKVEIRAYAYGDDNDRIDLTPVFSGGDGDEHQTTPGVSPGSWGIYQDITSDTNHPSPWTWTALQALDCKVEKDTVSKANQMNCAKVEIRVTYTPSAGGVAHTYGYIFG